MEQNGAKLNKGQFSRQLKNMLKFYSRKKGPLHCKYLLKQFFSNTYIKDDTFKSFGRVGEELPRLI